MDTKSIEKKINTDPFSPGLVEEFLALDFSHQCSVWHTVISKSNQTHVSLEKRLSFFRQTEIDLLNHDSLINEYMYLVLLQNREKSAEIINTLLSRKKTFEFSEEQTINIFRNIQLDTPHFEIFFNHVLSEWSWEKLIERFALIGKKKSARLAEHYLKTHSLEECQKNALWLESLSAEVIVSFSQALGSARNAENDLAKIIFFLQRFEMYLNSHEKEKIAVSALQNATQEKLDFMDRWANYQNIFAKIRHDPAQAKKELPLLSSLGAEVMNGSYQWLASHNAPPALMNSIVTRVLSLNRHGEWRKILKMEKIYPGHFDREVFAYFFHTLSHTKKTPFSMELIKYLYESREELKQWFIENIEHATKSFSYPVLNKMQDINMNNPQTQNFIKELSTAYLYERLHEQTTEKAEVRKKLKM